MSKKTFIGLTFCALSMSIVSAYAVDTTITELTPSQPSSATLRLPDNIYSDSTKAHTLKCQMDAGNQISSGEVRITSSLLGRNNALKLNSQTTSDSASVTLPSTPTSGATVTATPSSDFKTNNPQSNILCSME